MAPMRSFPAWLLALITLIVCSAIGVYYLNPALYTSVPDGFVSKEQNASPDSHADSEEDNAVSEGLTGTVVPESDSYKKLLASLNERTLSGGGADKPTAAQLSLAQGDDTGYSGTGVADYKPHQEIIKPHMTPTQLKAAIQAKVAADRGTQAQTIQEESVLTPSVRDMIRNDVKKAIKDEIRDINNEYEIQYDQ